MFEALYPDEADLVMQLRLEKQKHYTQADWDRLAQTPYRGSLTAEAVGIGAILIACAILYVLHRKTRFRVFGASPVERIGGLLLWPCGLFILGGVAAGDSLDNAPDYVNIGALVGASMRFIATPLLLWIATGNARPR